MITKVQRINHLERKSWNETTIERLGLHCVKEDRAIKRITLHMGQYVIYSDTGKSSHEQTIFDMHVRLEQFLVGFLTYIEGMKGAYQSTVRKS